MIVSTINVNGIRAAIKERSSENLGLLPWLAGTTADVVCLQETRADDDTTRDGVGAGTVRRLAPGVGGTTHQGAQRRCHPVAPSDRSGAADGVPTKFGSHGRYLEADTAGLTVASLYIQTGEADTDRQLEKERFMADPRRSGWPP